MQPFWNLRLWIQGLKSSKNLNVGRVNFQSVIEKFIKKEKDFKANHTDMILFVISIQNPRS